ncbi:MAG: HAD family hydrolase [Ardenticatenaceae bacterium]|nr:HAD family hydrolase [Anaerolineales bacterium]MCB8923379.1 HAD family hydrolase [Ardenticatenaceae bacterium]
MISSQQPNLRNVQAILFDMDGTLIDTDDQAAARLEERLRPFLKQRAPQAARWLLMKAETPGNILITTLDWLRLDELLMTLTDRLRRRRGVYPAHEFRLVPGVEEMLLRLHGRYHLGIVTTRSRYHIQRFLEQFPRIAPLFEVTCGLQDTRFLKPHPAPVRLAAKRLGLAPEQCLMVGDTTVDVRAARRANAWSIGVLCGFGERDELERAGAHAVLGSTADLTDFLQ